MASLAMADDHPKLLTDPFLLDPGPDSVEVVWFTEFEGQDHRVELGDGDRTIAATTTKLSRSFEDADSIVDGQAGDGSRYSQTSKRDIFRHAATVDALEPGNRIPYRVVSATASGETVISGSYSLAPLPPAGAPLRVLLTSDHQLKPMVPANLQMVEETVGRVDAVLFAGDLINVSDRASEWFDDARGLAFFPNLQGQTNYEIESSSGESRTYRGGAIIQHAPLYPVIGNHEVMGRFDPEAALRTQYNNPQPRHAAGENEDQSFNTRTFDEIFGLPEFLGGPGYYFRRFGDVALVGLYVTRIWRPHRIDGETRGKYVERDADLNDPSAWGWGSFPFETIEAGSAQYQWLEGILNSEEFSNAPYRVVMLHHPPRGFGGNVVPPFVEPEQIVGRSDDGAITSIRYEYAIRKDMLVHDLEPLLLEHDVQLVLFGHSHLWQHIAMPQGLHYLETANVGNNYGCYLEGGEERGNHPDDPMFEASNYARSGDPGGLQPTPPSVFAPQVDEAGKPLPCVASNTLTIFSILDTGKGAVESYVFDTRKPYQGVRLFDTFALK